MCISVCLFLILLPLRITYGHKNHYLIKTWDAWNLKHLDYLTSEFSTALVTMVTFRWIEKWSFFLFNAVIDIGDNSNTCTIIHFILIIKEKSDEYINSEMQFLLVFQIGFCRRNIHLQTHTEFAFFYIRLLFFHMAVCSKVSRHMILKSRFTKNALLD